MSLLFIIFQIYLKQIFRPSHSFVENFKRYLLIKKKYLRHGDNRREISKILTAQFFMGHPIHSSVFSSVLLVLILYSWSRMRFDELVTDTGSLGNCTDQLKDETWRLNE
jgi:hypothetical protein